VDVGFWFDLIGDLLGRRLPEASEGIEPLGQPEDADERANWYITRHTSHVICYMSHVAISSIFITAPRGHCSNANPYPV